jgi:hypothetical protein
MLGTHALAAAQMNTEPSTLQLLAAEHGIKNSSCEALLCEHPDQHLTVAGHGATMGKESSSIVYSQCLYGDMRKHPLCTRWAIRERRVV